jgi:Transposase DDE domain group 1
MPTQCIAQQFEFEAVERRAVVAAFDGGHVSSDAGALLLAQTDGAIGLIERFAECFVDRRNPDLIEHSVKTLVGQRVLGLALGYEDLIDHDELRHDPLLGAVLGKLAPQRRSDCAALAGKSTLNRLERTPHSARYHKVSHRPQAIETLFVELFLDAYAEAPARIVLDLDCTDDPVHGEQEGRFFHGYYRDYCYLPLYIFCDKHLVVAKLRPANIDGAAGSVEEVARVVTQIRGRWPKVAIILRADSGFAREALMAWCEASGVDYVFGLARNARLQEAIGAELAEAKRRCEAHNKPARLFKDFLYQTRDSWSAARRVIGKAEHLPQGANPRFIVTSLAPAQWEARALYEEFYCARGEMENRIKEQQLDLFADRTSTETMKANQLRLWFASMAYVLLNRLREVALAGTELANATVGTIRLKLLKIGAWVKLSVRRVRIAMASGYPYQEVFAHAYGALARLAASP